MRTLAWFAVVVPACTLFGVAAWALMAPESAVGVVGYVVVVAGFGAILGLAMPPLRRRP
jgi:hypothetical protein